MKSLFSSVLTVLLIFNIPYYKVIASENEAILNNSQITIANKYAEKYCSAKEDHFFEGLDNEKTLKYSYFRYIGLQSEEMDSKNMYVFIINKIREKCLISNDEERELNEVFTKKQ